MTPTPETPAGACGCRCHGGHVGTGCRQNRCLRCTPETPAVEPILEAARSYRAKADAINAELNPETPAGGLTEAERQELREWYFGDQYDDAGLIATVERIVAAAVVQARAVDRARIEAALALVARWEHTPGGYPVSPNEYARALRAALAATEDGNHP